jgi:hypothetical protein
LVNNGGRATSAVEQPRRAISAFARKHRATEAVPSNYIVAGQIDKLNICYQSDVRPAVISRRGTRLHYHTVGECVRDLVRQTAGTWYFFLRYKKFDIYETAVNISQKVVHPSHFVESEFCIRLLIVMLVFLKFALSTLALLVEFSPYSDLFQMVDNACEIPIILCECPVQPLIPLLDELLSITFTNTLLYLYRIIKHVSVHTSRLY